MSLADPTPAFAQADARPGPDIAAQVARLRTLLATYGITVERHGDLVTPRAKGTMGFGKPHAVVGIRCWVAGGNEIRVSSVEADGSILSVWADRGAFAPWTGAGAPPAPAVPRCTTEGSAAMADALTEAVMAGAVSLARYDLCRDHLRRAGHDVRIRPFDEAFVAAAARIEDRARRGAGL